LRRRTLEKDWRREDLESEFMRKAQSGTAQREDRGIPFRLRQNRSKGSVAMAGADTDTLATRSTAAAEHGGAGLGLHTRPKPVCFHAVTAVGLKCAFGHGYPLLFAKENAALQQHF
jgi:hypothetical protein